MGRCGMCGDGPWISCKIRRDLFSRSFFFCSPSGLNLATADCTDYEKKKNGIAVVNLFLFL